MQTTVIFIEQRPPFIFLLVSRIPTYAYFLISILAMILFTAFPSLTIAKPPVRAISRKPRSNSLTSNTSTLVDTDEADAAKSAPQDVSDKEKEPRLRRLSFSAKIHIPFNRLGSTFKEAGKSTARRMSMPIRRLSSTVAHAAHHLTPHHHPHIHGEADSYFFGKKSAEAGGVKGESEKVVDTSETTAVDESTSTVVTNALEQAAEAVPVAESKAAVQLSEEESPVDESAAPKKPSVFRKVTRRASIVLHINNLS